jgi:hypothetical protein
MNTPDLIIICCIALPFIAIILLGAYSITRNRVELDDNIPFAVLDKIGRELNKQVANEDEEKREGEYTVDATLDFDPLEVIIESDSNGVLYVDKVIAVNEHGVPRDLTYLLRGALTKYVEGI